MPSDPRISPAKLAFTAPYLLMWPALQLWLAGDWLWLEGWLFGVWFVAFSTVCIAWLYRNDPALLAERYRRPGTGGQSPADRIIVYGLLVGFLIWIVLPPLDSKRFGWTPLLPGELKGAGALLLLLAAFFLFRSFKDNTFLSPLARIQSERGHQVVSSGVYRLVRHPMYLGASLMFVGGPLLLGSVVGLLVGLALVLLLVVRIRGEERLLTRELAGYEDYRARVRYRLLPHIW